MWRGVLALAALAGAALQPWGRRRRGAALADLARLAGLAATAAFAWAGLLEVVLLAQPLLARELLLVIAGASLHGLLLVATDAIGGATSAAQRCAVRTAFAATAAVLSLGLVEWLFTWRMPANVYDVVPDDPRLGTLFVERPGRAHLLRPGFRGRCVHPEFPGLRVEINALGLRDRPDEGAPPAAGDAVVLVLGDSLAFGTGVKLEETFQEQLEARAAEITTRSLRVYGAGIPGYGQLDALDLLGELGPALHPDVVVEAIYEGNDLQDNRRATAPAPKRAPPARGPVGSTLLRDQGRRAGELDYWRGSSSALQFLWPALERPLAALGLVKEVLPINTPLAGMLRREPPRSVVGLGLLLVDALRRLRAKSDELGAAFVVLAIPAAIQADERLFLEFARDAPASSDGGGELDRTSFHRRLVDALRQDGFTVVDPLPALEAALRTGRGGYFREGHLDAVGHRIAAEELFAPVKRALAR